MGGYLPWRKPPETPIKNPWGRIVNLFKCHFRGIIGFFVPLCLLPPFGDKSSKDTTVTLTWFWMFWTLLLQPVNVPVAGFIPLFIFPMTAVMSSVETCKCYLNPYILLMIIGGWVLLLLNNSGFDRRAILGIMYSSKENSYTARKLVIKASVAAFVMSMFSNRLIVSKTTMEYVTPALMNMQSATARYRASEANYDKMRYVVNNAIQISSVLGSIVFVPNSYPVLAALAIWKSTTYQGMITDIYNYMQYTAFALPVAVTMFLLNLIYHIVLVGSKKSGVSTLSIMKKAMLKHKQSIPAKMTLHEILTLIHAILALALHAFRWSPWLTGASWAAFNATTFPSVLDVTLSAIFAIWLHIMPKGFGFLKYITAKKVSQLPPVKPESGILFWKFVDKNTNYGYIFLIGAGVALSAAVLKTLWILKYMEYITKLHLLDWNLMIFYVLLMTSVQCNMMSGCGSLIMLLPFFINIALKNGHLITLGIGIGSNFGFMCPFLFTPAYFCRNTGKVPRTKMALYSIVPVIICTIVLWAALCFYAKVIWSDISEVPSIPVQTTTEAEAST